jgi:hypothetical protein
MISGEQFRTELESDADLMASGRLGDLMGEPNARRARLWAKVGAEAIDDPDADKAIRYLLAATVNLIEQHAITMQSVINDHVRRTRKSLLVPLWISTVALVWIALKL